MLAGSLIVATLLRGHPAPHEDAPTLELHAGWFWNPQAHLPRVPPARVWWQGFGFEPRLGVTRAWTLPDSPWMHPYSFGYYPYFGIGYESRIRLHLRSGRPAELPPPDQMALPPVPGTAPTTLRDARQEQLWDDAIMAFLASLPLLDPAPCGDAPPSDDTPPPKP